MTRALRAIGRFLLLQPRAVAWIPPVAWAGFLWWSSSRSPEVGTGHWKMSAFGWNMCHAPTFGFLALMILPTLPREGGWARLRPRDLGLTLGLTALYGVLDEWHQSSTPGRHSSGLDVATDVVGAACVLWIAAYMGRADVEDAGLCKRLALGLALCASAAAVSTFVAI